MKYTTKFIYLHPSQKETLLFFSIEIGSISVHSPDGNLDTRTILPIQLLHSEKQITVWAY